MTEAIKPKRKMGLAAASVETRRRVASQGGQTISKDKEHMASLGRKGGQLLSQDRNHMAKIGSMGGQARIRRLREKQSLEVVKDDKSCVCDKCVSACKKVPGFFAPGEATKAAALLGMPFEQFRKEKLIESYMLNESDPHFLMPRKIGVDEGLSIASNEGSNTRGVCVFLKNDRCEIHEAKPMECRSAMLCKKTEDIRSDIVKMWEGVNELY